tara:strand:- start:1031 stop:1315 length:285 start_codon:yes stop_codon:yes gene_type:complete
LIRFYKEGEEVDLLDLGTTELGSTNRIELVMKNDFADKVELLDATVEDKGLEIIEFTSKLGIKEEGKIILEFSPSKDRTESLKDSKIKFRVVIG